MKNNTNEFTITCLQASKIIAGKLDSIKSETGDHFDRLRASLERAGSILAQWPKAAPVVGALGQFAPAAVDVLSGVATDNLLDAMVQLQREEKRALRPKAHVSHPFETIEEQVASVRARFAEAVEAEKPFTEEYRSRPWQRYFKVSNGHIHKGMDCSTCFPTTHYGWLPELSECDPSEMVAAYGEIACTVCFPDAPTMAGWGKLAKEAEDKFCASSGDYHAGGRSRRISHYAACPGCAQQVAITKGGKYRKHEKAKK